MTVPVPVPTEAHPTSTRFFIPDTLANWPWPRAINPAYEQCKLDSAAWCEKYKAFSPKAQKAFNLCDFNLLASLAYAHLPSDVNRVGCDLMNLFFVIDEHSDAMDRNSVNVWVEIIMDALRNPTKPRPDDEPIVGEITRTFWENAMKSLGPTSQRRFIDTFETYLYAVVVQAEDRDHHVFRDVDSYMTVRRDTIGAKPSFALLEHDMELPDEVFNHPLLEDLRTWCIDMLILGNDLCSYNVEQSRGDDGHNIVKLVMLQERTDLHGAMKYISDMHDALADQFLSNYRSMPSFGQPIDEWVERYIHGLGNWVRANDTWSFESWRYFKYDGLRIQKERWVELLPPANQEDLTSSIPPESRWIQPLVVPNRARPENVGIVAMEVYVPNRTSGNQDIINVTKDTLHSLISKYAIDPRSIGRFDVCFETSFSAAEIRSALLPIFTSVGNTDVQGSPSNQLCSGLFDTVNWIESRSWDGRYGIVITGHGVESGSTGASAILVGPNASIVVEPTHGTHLSSDVKQTSGDFHLDAFIGSYQRYEKKIPKDQVIEHAPAKLNGRINGHVNGVNGHTSKKNTCDFVIFGTPFGIVGNKSFLTNMLHTETFNNINWVDQLVPAATLLARKCGNAGMASIYIGLASLLSTEDVRSVKDKRVGVFDHRQSTSVFFTLKVVGDYSSIVDKISLQTRLRI